jgi:hypothetical protein
MAEKSAAPPSRAKPENVTVRTEQRRNPVKGKASTDEGLRIASTKRRQQPLAIIDLTLAPPAALQALESIGRRSAARFLGDEIDARPTFASVAREVGQYLRSDATINSGILMSLALLRWRSSVETMDDTERKQSIAALMAYVAELQAEGVLEGVPSGRLARVVKLIGEAVAVLSEPSVANAPLFRERSPSPDTGKPPTAIEWFELVWKERVMAGEVTGDDIRRHDAHYYSTLASALSKRGKKISEVLPPSPTRALKVTDIPEGEDRQRFLNRERVKRHRANKRNPK